MANTLSNAGIVDGQIIYAVQVNQIIDALTSADDYDVSVSGSLNVTGSISWSGSSDAAGAGVQFVVRDISSGELYTTGSSAFDFKLSGSFPAERLVITGLTSSANPGGLDTNNNLRTYDNNNGIAIGGSEGNNGVNGLGFIISENPSNGNHAILSDGSGSNLNIRAAGGDAGNSYVVILADQPGIDITDVFTIAKFGGPLRSTELYHTGSLVFYTNKINGTGSVYITGSLSGSGDVYFPGIPNTVTPHIVGFDTASGKFTYYDTSSFGGAVFNTSSLMITGSVLSNVLTFTKGDGSTFSLTVDTGSASSVNTGSFYYSSSVNLNTITFFQGDGTTESVTVNTGSGGTVNTGSFMITGSIAGSTLLFEKGDGSTFNILLPGGGGGNPITGSYTGSVLTTNIQSIDFIGAGVIATVGGANDITVNIPGGGSTDTGSLMVTGSVLSNVLTFTKGDGSTFSLTVDTGSASSVNTGSLMVTGSVLSNVLTFTKGDGSTFSLTVDTGSIAPIDTGSFYVSSSVSDATITFTQGDGSTDHQVTVNNVVSASYALTSSHTPEALVTASLAGSTLIFEKGDNSQFSLVLPGGGGGNPITGSYTGSVLTTTIQSIDFIGAGVIATVGGANDITVNIPGGGSTDTGSLMVTGSVSDATLTFTKGNGSTFPLTVNNVNNAVSASFATTASYVLNAVSASFAPNIYNSDGAVSGNRLVSVGANTLTFRANLTGGTFKVDSSATGDVIVTGLPSGISSSLLAYNTATGKVISMATSSIQNVVSASNAISSSYAVSASYAPNIYNSDGSLTGNRQLDVNGNNLSIIAQTGDVIITSDPSYVVAITDIPQESKPSLIFYNDGNGQLTYNTTSSFTASWASNSVSASFAPNIYNSNGTLTGNREVNLSNYDLKFNNTGAKFIISGSDRVVFNNLSQGNNGYVLTYDLLGDSGTQGIVNYISTSSLSVASASYAPNLYNSDGTLTGNRTVLAIDDTLMFRLSGSSEFRISDGTIAGPNTYDFFISGSDLFAQGLLQNTSQINVVGYDLLTGQLTYFSTSSLGGGTVNTGSLLVTGSVSNATLTFTKGDGSTFPLTINNVANATTAGSVDSDSVYAEAGTDFDVWVTAGNTFTLLTINGTNIETVAPKTVGDSSKLLAVTTMEVYRGDTGTNFTAFQYRLFNSTQAAAIPGSTRDFSSYMIGSGEGVIPTTFTFTLPISANVTSGDTIELQVRQSPSAALGIYSSASISYGDLALVSITN